jgi:hypothetical protein
MRPSMEAPMATRLCRAGRRFSKFKALLRAAAAQNIPDLFQAIAATMKRFTQHECRNCPASGEYDAY